jgi:hypothetical protein
MTNGISSNETSSKNSAAESGQGLNKNKDKSSMPTSTSATTTTTTTTTVVPAAFDYLPDENTDDKEQVYAPGDRLDVVPTLKGPQPANVSFSISPKLPSGAHLNAGTGAIYGSFSKSVRAGDYNFLVTSRLAHSPGSASAKLEMIVKTPPESVTYASSAFTTCGINTLYPQTKGATPSSYSISPKLPHGIVLNKQTGVISGQPVKKGNEVPGVIEEGSTSAEAYYVLKARNAVGSSESKIMLKFSNPKKCPTFPWGIVAAVGAALLCVAACFALLSRRKSPYKQVAGYEPLTTNEPVLVPPAGTGMGLPLTWETGNGKKTVFATRKPLGLLFDKEKPIRVIQDREGHGFDLGVREGWILTSINYVDIQWMNFDEQNRLLHTEVGKLPGSIPLTFATPPDGMKTVWASQKPLGLIFEKDELPITISAVREGHSKDIGVQVGWVLKSINYKDVSVLNSFQEVDDILRAEVARLPRAAMNQPGMNPGFAGQPDNNAGQQSNTT